MWQRRYWPDDFRDPPPEPGKNSERDGKLDQEPQQLLPLLGRRLRGVSAFRHQPHLFPLHCSVRRAPGGRAAIPWDDSLKDFSVERLDLNLEIERFQLVIIASPGEEQDPDLFSERLLRPREESGQRLGVVGAGILLLVFSRKDHLPQRAGVYP